MATAMNMTPHPLSAMFPALTDPALKRLADSIQTVGLLEPITTFNGQILDGNHRYQACKAAKVTPRFEEYTGNDPLGFVAAKNAHRRHLTKAQAADFCLLEYMGGEQTGKRKYTKADIQARCKEFGISYTLLMDLKKLKRVAPALADKVVNNETIDGKPATVTKALEKATGQNPRKATVKRTPCAPSRSTQATRDAAKAIQREQEKASKRAPTVTNVEQAEKPLTKAQQRAADNDALEYIMRNINGAGLSRDGVHELRNRVNRWCDQQLDHRAELARLEKKKKAAA